MINNIKIDKNLVKTLIIGANGFLGSNILSLTSIKRSLNKHFYFIAADLKNSNIPAEIPFYHIDITNSKVTTKMILKISPTIIILTSAMTDVDECERNKKKSTQINFHGTKNVIKACRKIDCKLLFMSTDFVFDGTKEKGSYNEEDMPNPLSHYGKTKYKAEQVIINSNIDYLICRTAVLYGWNKNKLNFITWILKNLEKKNPISVDTTQINNPTFVKNLTQILLKLIENNANGIFHTAGDGSLSRYEMALQCAEVFNYDKNLITPVENFYQRATRPKNAGLDIFKLKRFLGPEFKIYSLDDGLKNMKKNRI